jgi:hypothetical protein
MTHYLDDRDRDDALAAFLKAHRSCPPSPASQFEDRLMDRIDREPQLADRRSYYRWWGIPTAIAAGAVMAWGGSQWMKPYPMAADNTAEIEEFLVENWTATLNETSSPRTVVVPATDWINVNPSDPRLVGARR